jgi:starch phosphorylase
MRFYDVDGSRLPRRWIEMVRHTLQSLGPQVLASRMVRDYVVELYSPAVQSSRAMAKDGFAPARDLAAWIRRIRDGWSGVQVMHVESSGVGDAPELGQQLDVRALVDLGSLDPGDVSVQVAFGQVDEEDELRDPEYVELTRVDNVDGAWRYEGAVPLERRGPFGYTVRVLPDNPALASRAELGLIALPVESTNYVTV